MAKPRSAGNLVHRVAFDRRINANPDSPADYGNTVGAWVEQFRARAGYIHLRGGEQVIAARLQSQHPQVIFVRRSANTLGVHPDWRIRDVRTGVTYNVRDVTLTEDRLWVDFLCQSGVADG